MFYDTVPLFSVLGPEFFPFPYFIILIRGSNDGMVNRLASNREISGSNPGVKDLKFRDFFFVCFGRPSYSNG